MMFNFVKYWGDAHDFIELIEGSLNIYKSIKILIPHKDSRVDSFQMTIKTEKVRMRKWGTLQYHMENQAMRPTPTTTSSSSSSITVINYYHWWII